MTIIRNAEISDRAGAEALRSRVLPSSHPYKYEQNIGIDGCLNLVAEEERTIVGFISALLTRWDPAGRCLWERVAPYVAFIGVQPEKQGRGIGTTLLQRAIPAAVVLCPNEPLLFLEHDQENPAQVLYDKVGFRVMPRQEVFEVSGLNISRPVMCLDLKR